MKKEFILQLRNNGKFLGRKTKIRFDDEELTGNYIVNCEVLLSNTDGFDDIKKGDKIKVTLEKYNE